MCTANGFVEKQLKRPYIGEKQQNKQTKMSPFNVVFGRFAVKSWKLGLDITYTQHSENRIILIADL